MPEDISDQTSTISKLKKKSQLQVIFFLQSENRIY